MSRLAILLLVACVATLTQAQSYAALAAVHAPPQFAAVIAQISQINNTMMPQDVYTVRHTILYLRDLLDIFAYAYPNNTGPRGSDIWVYFRNDTNYGYTAIGNFQDLNASAVNYTWAELVALRNICVEWKMYFLENVQVYNYAAYVSKPDPDAMYDRPLSEETPFYWVYSIQKPSLQLTGVQNIILLTVSMIDEAIYQYPLWQQLKHPYMTDEHTIYHDYRKMLRGILSIYLFFPTIWSSSAATQTALNTTHTAFENIGNLNDIITAYLFYKQYGPKSSEKIEEAIVKVQWPLLLNWTEQINLVGVLDQVETGLVATGEPPIVPISLRKRAKVLRG